MMVAKGAIRDLLQFLTLEQLDITNSCRRPQMVADREAFIKPFRREHMLVGDTLVFVSRRAITVKPDMMLARNLA